METKSEMIVYIIIISAFQTHYININMVEYSKLRFGQDFKSNFVLVFRLI